MIEKHSTKQLVVVAVICMAVGMFFSPHAPTTSRGQQPKSAQAATVAATVKSQTGEASGPIKVEKNGQITFYTPGDDGGLNRRMQLTKPGCLSVGDGTIGGIPGGLELAMNQDSRPGAIVMRNHHKAAMGVGNTLAYYASGHGQVFLSSSWVGETRRVKQQPKRPLPANYQSTDYPQLTSAARMEIGARVHDWVSLAAIFEPIADDGRPLVVSDREHPYMGQVQYLEPGGEWINNRRLGRHALIIGTTHSTGATAGGVVMAGDSYHEYAGKGPVIKSPNGTAFRIVVDDEGNLSTEKFIR